MIWFLRLFSRFANLERQLESAQADCQRAWVELEYHRTHAQQLDARLVELTQQLVNESHKVADTMSLHALGKRIYGHGSIEPPSEIGEIRPSKPFARERVLEQQRHTREELQRLMAEFQTTPNPAS